MSECEIIIKKHLDSKLMTQPTIKEKIQEIAMINEAAYGHVHVGFIRAFARLICEEMTEKKC